MFRSNKLTLLLTGFVRQRFSCAHFGAPVPSTNALHPQPSLALESVNHLPKPFLPTSSHSAASVSSAVGSLVKASHLSLSYPLVLPLPLHHASLPNFSWT